MTGQQGNPGSGETLRGVAGRRVPIEPVVRAMGVEKVWKVNALDEPAVDAAIKEALAVKDQPSVVIVEGTCVFLDEFKRRTVVSVDLETCNGCSLCFRVGCPAILNRPRWMPRPGGPRPRLTRSCAWAAMCVCRSAPRRDLAQG